MKDSQVKPIAELLGLAGDVKTRLRHLETLAAELSSDAHRAAHIPGEAALSRVRNHLELALQALGQVRRQQAPAPAEPADEAREPENLLKITGYYSEDVQKALHALREARGPHPGASARGKRAGGVWVQNRVDEINRALTSAFGDEEMLPDSKPNPRPFSPPEFVGSTDALSVPELIGFFQLQAKTGVLVIDGESETYTLEYLRGELIHAASSRSPDGERLGEILVRLGYVEEWRLAHLLAAKTQGERFGELLRRGDILSEEAIAGALQEQVQNMFLRMCDVPGCRFSFREGLEGEPRARVRYNVTRLLLETARKRDEKERNPDRDEGKLAS